MKVRIHENSVRFRLSQTEVKRFHEDGICSNKIVFPNENALVYNLAQDESLGIDFADGVVTISLPKSEAENWATTDKVGISGSFDLENNTKLDILVEKDFKCLTKRDEDESDMFPNPNKAHS